MGFTEVKLTLQNPKGGSLRVIPLLVDSGALYSVVPSGILRELAIEPQEELDFQLANGQVIKRKVGEARFTVSGRQATSKVVFGEAGDHSLLGVVTLESLGLELDPIRRELRPAPLLLL